MSRRSFNTLHNNMAACAATCASVVLDNIGESANVVTGDVDAIVDVCGHSSRQCVMSPR